MYIVGLLTTVLQCMLWVFWLQYYSAYCGSFDRNILENKAQRIKKTTNKFHKEAKLYKKASFLTYINRYSMQQSASWEANQFAVSQDFPRVLWKPKVHYSIHKCPLTVPILSQNPTSHFLKIQLNIVSLSTPGSPKWFPHENPVNASRLLHTRYIPRPSNSSRIYHP